MTARTAAGQVADVVAHLRAAEAGIVQLAESVDDATWMQRPPSGGWSASECIAHLTLSNAAFMPQLREGLDRVPRGAPVPHRYRTGLMGWLIAWSLEPPSRSRTKTAPAFVPGGAEPRSAVIASFAKSHADLFAWLAQADGVPLNRIMIESPFARRVRYNAYALLRITAAHERRHLWQAQRAVAGIP